MKIKSTDNAKELVRQRRRLNRLSSIRNGIEGGTIKSWEQVFAIITESRMSTELGISFYAFRKKCKDPGEFSINEIGRFAALVGVKFDTMHAFILNQVKARTNSKIFRE